MPCWHKFTRLCWFHRHTICCYILCTCHMKPRHFSFSVRARRLQQALCPSVSHFHLSSQMNSSFLEDNSSPVNFVRSSWWGEKSSSPTAGRARQGQQGQGGQARPRQDAGRARQGPGRAQAGQARPRQGPARASRASRVREGRQGLGKAQAGQAGQTGPRQGPGRAGRDGRAGRAREGRQGPGKAQEGQTGPREGRAQ